MKGFLIIAVFCITLVFVENQMPYCDLDKNNLKEFAKCVRREFSIEALEIWDSCRGHILPEEDELTTVRALCKMNETGRKLSSCLRPLLILEGDLLQEIVNGCLP